MGLCGSCASRVLLCIPGWLGSELFVAETGLKPLILLPQISEYWDCGHVLCFSFPKFICPSFPLSRRKKMKTEWMSALLESATSPTKVSGEQCSNSQSFDILSLGLATSLPLLQSALFSRRCRVLELCSCPCPGPQKWETAIKTNINSGLRGQQRAGPGLCNAPFTFRLHQGNWELTMIVLKLGFEVLDFISPPLPCLTNTALRNSKTKPNRNPGSWITLCEAVCVFWV